MEIKRKICSLILGGIIFTSCQSETSTKSDAPAVEEKVDSVENVPTKEVVFTRDSSVDFSARYISGLAQLTKNSFSDLEDEAWQEIAKGFSEAWDKLEKERLSVMRNWEKETFSTWKNDSLTVFYPFSGPDFLHADVLYPKANRFVLLALEPIVEMPVIPELTQEKRNVFLKSLDFALRDIFQKSYFITTHMQEDFRGDQAKGVLPVFSFFLTRSGYEILELDAIGIDTNGVVQDTLLKGTAGPFVKGVRFRFRHLESDTLKELFYFSANISDKGLAHLPGMIKYLETLGEVNTFVKSASYMPHYNTFSRIRNFMLKNSKTIFQDDTGLPYEDVIVHNEWKIRLIGEYTKPVKDFGDYVFQKDLDSAYRMEKNLIKLPFHLGYHWNTKTQSHQFYYR
jgi:hypothetical protein